MSVAFLQYSEKRGSTRCVSVRKNTKYAIIKRYGGKSNGMKTLQTNRRRIGHSALAFFVDGMSRNIWRQAFAYHICIVRFKWFRKSKKHEAAMQFWRKGYEKKDQK